MSRTVWRLGAALCLAVMLSVAILPLSASAAVTGDGHPDMRASGVEPQAPTPMDAWEPDDTPQTATPLKMGYADHTWHPMPLPEGGNDVDWFYVTVAATGTPILLETVTPARVGSFTDPYINVYDEDGVSAITDESVGAEAWNPDMVGRDGNIAFNDDKMYGSMDAMMAFVAPHPGKYYIRVQSDDLMMNQWGEYRLYANVGIGRRVSGADRYKGAVAVSKLFWGDVSQPWEDGRSPMMGIVIASGEKLPDAMTGGMLAANTGSPLMLSKGPDIITSQMLDEIERIAERSYYLNYTLGARAQLAGPGGPVPPSYPKLPLYVVGGTDSISDALARRIDASPYLGEVYRIGGADRYQTCAMVMDTIMWMHMGPKGIGSASAAAAPEGTSQPSTRVVFVASGLALPDVVSAAPVAAGTCSSLLLTRKDSIPASTTAYLNNYPVDHIVVVGSEESVSKGVYDKLALICPSIERVAGENRYKTNKALVDWLIADPLGKGHPVDTARMILVSGTAPADAMMVVPLSTQMGNVPVLLTRPDLLSPTVKAHMDVHKPLNRGSYAVGGTASLWTSTFNTWNRYGWPYAYAPDPDEYEVRGLR